uniref:PRA1 family protein n=1 Tax=Elaeis guineensis var. tenera TaxID=51953 RepID=A0A6I9R971_ELAGV|nr:PRA1 family protein B1 [Elaeis guineensis]
MMATTPAPTPTPLPISNPQSGAAAATASSGSTGSGAAPIATPAFRLFLSRLSDSVSRSLSNRRPWSELIDRSAFSRPDSLSDASFRVRKNFAYFRVNYVALLAAVLALSLLSNPFSLLVLLGLLAAWCFLYLFRPADPPLVLFGRTFSDRETLGALVFLSVFVIFLTSVGSLLISALMVGVAIVCAHGAFRVPEDLFLDDQEPGGAAAGLLSFLGGTASTATAAAVPAVAARV